ncbi:SpoIIAA family protein [Marivirga arenosa]|uniref:STAS/SEC14 domain-containing protein n=1 Tax=Marivirga arenosa TaxID=3059076 RepID=A0AA51NBA7_9BACT|nr:MULTISPECIES: STAS/SEC14 domain-containing protein [unclassified Marivirga]WMN07950.1 STAS/SEC14 domain-containing protein [Marivirga sp. ABR2-2]WNB17840.1 STAS/SEC14 domain-containing protein [Marivirga sp. BKB1-2]
MKTYATIDSSEESLIKVTFTGEKSTDENFNQYLSELSKIYDNRINLSIIFDARKAGIPKLSHQKKQATWLSEHWKLMEKYCNGTAYVISNAAIRAVLKVIFSFQNQPVPYKIFSTIDEAKEWVSTIDNKKAKKIS